MSLRVDGNMRRGTTPEELLYRLSKFDASLLGRKNDLLSIVLVVDAESAPHAIEIALRVLRSELDGLFAIQEVEALPVSGTEHLPRAEAQ